MIFVISSMRWFKKHMVWLYYRKLKFFDFRPKGVHHQLFEKKRFLSFFNSFLEHFLKSTPYFVRFGAINPNFKVLPLQTFIKMVLKRGKYFRVFSWISKPLVSIVIFFEYFFSKNITIVRTCSYFSENNIFNFHFRK